MRANQLIPLKLLNTQQTILKVALKILWIFKSFYEITNLFACFKLETIIDVMWYDMIWWKRIDEDLNEA